MGLLDRFKGQRSGGDAGGPRAPSNFDELQAAEDADLDASAADMATPTVPADPGPETLANEAGSASAAESRAAAAPVQPTASESAASARPAGERSARPARPAAEPADRSEVPDDDDDELTGRGLDINLPTVTPTLAQLREDMGADDLADDDLDDRRRDAAHYRERDLNDSRLLPIGESRLDAGMDSTDSRPSMPDGMPRAAMGGAAAAVLPLIGHRSVAQQQRILVTVLILGLVLLVLTIIMALSLRNSGQGPVVDAALIQLERLGRATAMAAHGEAPLVDEVRQAGSTLVARVRELRGPQGESDTAWRAPAERLGQQALALANQQKAMSETSAALRALDSASAEWLDGANAVAAMKLQLGASPAELSAANQLVLVTQRIGKSASEFLLPAGPGPEALQRVEQGLTRFGELAQGLLDGDATLQLPGTRAPSVRDRLEQLLRQHGVAQAQASTALGHQQAVLSGREARQAILDGLGPVRQQLERQQGAGGALGGVGGLQPVHLAALLAALLMVMAAAYGLLRLFVTDQAQRAAQAEAQRREAELQEREAKRVNDANQAAILRLMNELQAVGEGDLTQQATVTEDITGAIADSVNYTVEELRSLVSQVQRTVLRVADATDRVDTTSIELLAASDEQLREIRETGDAVLRMAERINSVSKQSQQSAAVARQSRHAAASGLTAVQNSIDGMNAIRDQIQETSKRIKRLGESSQEIGEITELISDITEQTNVLALNAAIQAASAGEAGRGFSVVAEEVQRLAERSADATREIAALVKAIQTDTQDAVAAMARSTEGVVQGAQLSDAAGTALAEIDRVSRQLAELIESISDVTSREADSANVVAGNIQHIFAVTEQTGDGTRSTAQIVRELSRTADELRQSVARFKIG